MSSRLHLPVPVFTEIGIKLNGASIGIVEIRNEGYRLSPVAIFKGIVQRLCWSLPSIGIGWYHIGDSGWLFGRYNFWQEPDQKLAAP